MSSASGGWAADRTRALNQRTPKTKRKLTNGIHIHIHVWAYTYAALEAKQAEVSE